jgi:DNA-binding transcriptional MerR regulator
MKRHIAIALTTAATISALGIGLVSADEKNIETTNIRQGIEKPVCQCPEQGQKGPRIDFAQIAEAIGISEEELKEELIKAKEEGKRLFEFLQEKGLSEEEIKELLPKPPQGQGHGPKIDFQTIADKLGMNVEELVADLKTSGMNPIEYLKNKGLSAEEIKELLPPKGEGRGEGRGRGQSQQSFKNM